MKQILQKLANKIVDNLNGKNLARLGYFIAVVAVAIIGFDNPEAVAKILKALAEALSILL